MHEELFYLINFVQYFRSYWFRYDKFREKKLKIIVLNFAGESGVNLDLIWGPFPGP